MRKIYRGKFIFHDVLSWKKLKKCSTILVVKGTLAGPTEIKAKSGSCDASSAILLGSALIANFDWSTETLSSTSPPKLYPFAIKPARSWAQDSLNPSATNFQLAPRKISFEVISVLHFSKSILARASDIIRPSISSVLLRAPRYPCAAICFPTTLHLPWEWFPSEMF